MAAPFTIVRPGDIISSESHNFILTKIQGIRHRGSASSNPAPAPGRCGSQSFDPQKQTMSVAT